MRQAEEADRRAGQHHHDHREYLAEHDLQRRERRDELLLDRALAEYFRRFDFEPLDAAAVQPASRVTIRPRDGIRCRLRPRR